MDRSWFRHTCVLDTETERAIQQALADLSHGRTTLIIAHRLTMIAAADRIVVIERGAMVEQGGHGELLARRGVYRRLSEAQFGAMAS